jgi:alkylation response protein AidB-like acyl-CoA dehydrogenase
VATRAVDLLADSGTLHANRVEKALRDARLNQIYEGTNQINRLALIEAFGDADFAGAA